MNKSLHDDVIQITAILKKNWHTVVIGSQQSAIPMPLVQLSRLSYSNKKRRSPV